MPNNLNRNYKGHELFIASMQDQFNLVHLRKKSIVTSFLSLSQQEIIRQICPDILHYSFYGGFENAIRKVCCIQIDDCDTDYEVCCLSSKIDSRFKDINHRDILGSLMSLGIERNQIGDLVIDQGYVYIFCKTKISEYIINYCTFIKKVPVSLNRIDSCELHVQMFKEIHINCASLRLDAIVAQLAHCSRKEAMNKIQRKSVKLNDIELEQNRQLCLNDIVMIHRIGKFIYKGIVSKTKKDRMILKFDQFI